MAERILQFGPDRRLFGFLSGTPTAATAHILVLLNAGTMPRTGPFRLYVELARRLARRAMPVFRLDLPGVGEAPMLSDCTEEEALVAALDMLAAVTGCNRFVVGGICSASDIAWRLSEKDTRVTGLLLLDGVAFTGPWFWLARWRDFLARPPGAWWRALRRRISPKAQTTQPAAADFRDWPTREQAHAHMREMQLREARIFFAFTSAAWNRFRHPRQMKYSFGPAAIRPGVQLHLWPGSDHLYFLRSYRETLMAAIERWLIEPSEGSSQAPLPALPEARVVPRPRQLKPRQDAHS